MFALAANVALRESCDARRVVMLVVAVVRPTRESALLAGVADAGAALGAEELGKGSPVATGGGAA